MSTEATSGRVNSGGGACPARSISRTLVPLKVTRSVSPCGHVASVSHRGATAAVKSVLEEERLNPQLVGAKLVENTLGVVRAVVIPYARMIRPTIKCEQP